METTTQAPSAGAATNPPSAASGQPQTGVPEKPAGTQDGKPTNPNDPFNLGWDKAKEHYAAKLKERDDKLAGIQSELDALKTKGMNADQLAGELSKARQAEQAAREQAESLSKFISGSLDARVNALPEKYRGILQFVDKANHEAYAKAVAQAESIAAEGVKTQPSQGSALPPVPSGVDVQGIVREIHKGNTKPYHEAIKAGVKKAELDAAVMAADPQRKR